MIFNFSKRRCSGLATLMEWIEFSNTILLFITLPTTLSTISNWSPVAMQIFPQQTKQRAHP